MTAHQTPAPAIQEPAISPTSGEVDQIRAGIERTQANLAETVAELQRKLTWSHFFGQTRKALQESLETCLYGGFAMGAVTVTTMEHAVDKARSRLRRDPLSATLLGAGLAAALWQGIRWKARYRGAHRAKPGRVLSTGHSG
jgi:hypothetical protein